VKPRRVDLGGVRRMRDVIDAVVRTRREETLELSVSLESREPAALHDFRIACKRLRYAMERFCDRVPEFQDPAQLLAQIQDALGEAHDRDVLLAILPPTMPETERRLKDERDELVNRATQLWEAFRC
jgi:CHAD domain-containing protein